MSSTLSVTVTRQEKYRFTVDFGGELEALTGDEPAPLGGGAGPSPTQFLVAAIANCLSASFIFALGKYKEDPGAVTTTVQAEIGRNEQNRLRVLGMAAELKLGVPAESLAHLERAIATFEDFCTVTASVKAGIPVKVTVSSPDRRSA